MSSIDTKTLEILNAYADGVNDFIAGVGLLKEGGSAHLLPPEFYLLGHTDIEPWRVQDSLALLKLLNFHLSWNWSQDFIREFLTEINLEDMIEEIFPFTAEFSDNMVTILNDEDIAGTSFWHNQTIMQRYYS